ncbi:hypothetical protein [Nocardioides speluncae]|uniref:hypothetical protein n=1 Tax=Nocardioides speluncae TaxID=2670337 RepID=UPI000D688047|nr:hypothetical protein [Nocardioides speluncae]
MRKRRLTIVGVVLALVAAVAIGVVVWQRQDRTDLERALEFLPGETMRVAWTDWHGVRDELGADVDADSPGEDAQKLVDDGFEPDLTSGSAMVQSALALHEKFGFSPASVEWEALGQSDEGAVVALRLADDADFDELAKNLVALGYTDPAEEDGVWQGGIDLMPKIDPSLNPEFQYVALLADERMVLTSDESTYLETALETAKGDHDSLESVDDVASVAAAAGDAVSGVLMQGEHACQALAMSQADSEDQRIAEDLVADAGDVNPLTGFLLASQPGGEIRAVLGFEGDDQAEANTESRRRLAEGPAPGQGGDFSERFSVESAEQDGRNVVLTLDPVEGEYVVSDLSHGPVLFATC